MPIHEEVRAIMQDGCERRTGVRQGGVDSSRQAQVERKQVRALLELQGGDIGWES